jgi:membrane-bound serine protease (ClpP class)
VTVLATAGFFIFAVSKVVRVHRLLPTTGQEGLIGQEGRAESRIATEGKVFVRGEYWDAWSEEPIDVGTTVVVEAVKGMRIKVKRMS